MRCIRFLLPLLISPTVLARPADDKSKNGVATSNELCNNSFNALCSGLRSDLQKDEAFLDPFRYYNYHEKAEDLLVSTIVKTLFPGPQIVEYSSFPDAPPNHEMRVRRAVKDSDEISRILGGHAYDQSRVAQARLLADSLEQFVPKHVRELHPSLQTTIQEIITSVKENLGRKSTMAKEMYEDDWNMDRRIAIYLSGKKDGLLSPQEFARYMDFSVIEMIQILKKLDMQFGDGRIKALKEQWVRHIHSDCVDTFKLLEILHKAREMIRKEKSKNPTNTIDDDTRLIALLKTHPNYQSNPIQVQEAVQQARDEITFLHAIYHRRLPTVRRIIETRQVFPSTLDEEITDALTYTLYAHDYEMLDVLLQHHAIVPENLHHLLEAAIMWNPEDVSESKFLAQKKEMLSFLLKHEQTGRQEAYFAIYLYGCSSQVVRFEQYDMIASVFVESGKITMEEVESLVKGVSPELDSGSEYDTEDEDEIWPWLRSPRERVTNEQQAGEGGKDQDEVDFNFIPQ